MTLWATKKRFIRNIGITLSSVAVIIMLFQFVGAGSLAPSAAPASSSASFENLYSALVGTFDSSGIVASESAGALEIAKCIMNRMTGGTCP